MNLYINAIFFYPPLVDDRNIYTHALLQVAKNTTLRKFVYENYIHIQESHECHINTIFQKKITFELLDCNHLYCIGIVILRHVIAQYNLKALISISNGPCELFELSTYHIIIICSCLPMKLWINSTKELDDTGYIVFEWLTYLPWNVCGIKRHTHAGKSQVCKAFPRNLYVVCHWFVFCCNKVSFFIFLRGLSSINFLFGWPYSRVKGFPILGQEKTPPWY